MTKDDEVADADPVLRIGEVALRTNVSVDTLRAWERRYGLLAPARTAGGHRLYSDRDVARVRTMAQLVGRGWSASVAARHVLDGTVGKGSERPGVDELVARLHQAVVGYDAPAVADALDDTFAAYDVVRALDEVVLPAVRVLGDGWQDDPEVVAREHFATQTVRPRLQQLLHAASRIGGPVCVAAAPEFEEHDFGLLAGSLTAADAGWNVHYLGARTPADALRRGVVTLQPQVVLIGTVFRDHAESFLDQVGDLGATGMVLGGRGFVLEDQQRVPHAIVHTGPMRDLPATLNRAAQLATAAV
ncbi:MAG: MerR family transcriptional regulator [Nitriliruptoraceae bacterium]